LGEDKERREIRRSVREKMRGDRENKWEKKLGQERTANVPRQRERFRGI